MFFYTVIPKLLNMSFTASVAIVCVLLLRLLLKKAPKVISYALWSVVLFRLLCPVSIESSFSLFGLMDAPTTGNTTMTSSIEYVPENIVHTEYPVVTLPAPGVSDTINSTLPQGQEQLAADPLETPVVIAAYVWMVGVLCMAAYSAAAYVRLRRKLLTASLLKENIYLADEISSPFVMGLIRPKIYLPSDIEEREQAYIILHEQHHIGRGDHIVKALAFLALSIHWFNPLVWVAFICSGRDMEMSCDEAVVKKMGDEILADYTASLLSLATGKRIIAGMSLAFGEGDTKGRIRNLANWRKPAFWVVVMAVVLCLAAAVCLVTNPEENPEELPTVDQTAVESDERPAVTWTHSPMLSATWHAAFHFNFALNDSSYVEASCNNGTLWNLQAEGQPKAKALRFEAGEPVCWTPDMDDENHAETVAEAAIDFTVFVDGEILCSGTLDITRAGTENGQSVYEARLGGTHLISLQQSAGNMGASLVPSDRASIVAWGDLNRNRVKDCIVVREVEPGMLYELSVLEDGVELWSTQAGTAHVGWNTILRYREDDQDYLVQYQPAMFQGVGSYTCTVFSLEGNQKTVKEEWSVDFESSAEETPAMERFAKEVGVLLRNCGVMLSTEQGIVVDQYARATSLPQLYPVRFDPSEIWAAIEGNGSEQELTANAADFPDVPLKFLFASGAGGWGTELVLNPDGSFAGSYSDSERGINAPEYPNGTLYVCEFEGQFSVIRQISDYAWAMKLTGLSTQLEPGETWIEAGVRFIAAEPFGIAGGEEFILYAPEAPADALTDDHRSWWPDAALWLRGEQEVLGGWGLCNINTRDNFFTAWYS